MTTPGKRLKTKPYIKDCVCEVLKKTRKPLHYTEITESVVKVRPIVGRTPEKSVYSVLVKNETLFKFVGAGRFILQAPRRHF